MSLSVHILIHVLLALAAGFAVWHFFRRSFWLILGAAVLGGVFIDLDHLYDYFLAYGFQWNLSRFLGGEYFSLNEKVYVLFHGWEYVILLTLAALFFRQKRLQSALFSLALGMLVHLGADLAINRGMTFEGYSIGYRIIENFDIYRVSTSESGEKEGTEKAQ